MKKSKGSKRKPKPMPGGEWPRWYGCYDHPRDQLFTVESNRHPAKMAVGLCERIFTHGRDKGYWKPGDVILDPMAGIGTTLLVGAVLGYRTVGVELESHFLTLCQQNIEHARRWFAPGAGAQVVQGDARKLSHLFIGSSGDCKTGAVSSPPYADQQVTASSNVQSYRNPTGTPARDGHHLDGYTPKAEGGSQNAEPNPLPLAPAVGGALCSPPYGGRDDHGADPHPERMDGPGTMFRGYDSAVTSPPYSEVMTSQRTGPCGQERLSEKKGIQPSAYSRINDGAQIGNLRDPKNDIERVIAAAVTSPPWEKQARGGQQGWADPAEAARIAAERYQDGSRAGHPARAEAIEAQMRRDSERTYGDAPGQIGQMEKETYCAAMLAVYRELHAVLRPGGVVALVTKNPVKGGQIRRLDLDTIRLMEAAGFQFLERQMAMLASPEVVQQGMGLAFATQDEQGQPITVEVGKTVTLRRERKSFFKRLHEKRYPHLRVDHEDVLWFRKEAVSPQLTADSEAMNYRQAGGAVSSPPYLEAPGGGGINVKGYGEGGHDKVGNRTYSRRTVSGQQGE